jgi:ectoine hydroxylase-related dioxygenase (phytanoyl-CoA dioxygenase family)
MRLTNQERAERRLSDETIAAIRATFEEDGFFTLEAVVGPEPLAACRAAVREELAREHRFETFPGRDGIGTSFFEFEGPFADPEIVGNPFLLQVLHALLGPGVSCSVYNTNVSKPGAEQDQPVHVDIPSRTAEGSFWFPHVSLHLTLCDFTEENGCTELWPGTHHLVARREEDLEAQASDRASYRAVLPAGSFLFRDASVWHRGRVNHTDEVRDMLSMMVIPEVPQGSAPVYIRPLVIRREVLERLSPEAQAMWAVNELVG